MKETFNHIYILENQTNPFKALKDIFAKYQIVFNNDLITYNNYGKPYYEGIFFSIADDTNILVIAISNQECGVDVLNINRTPQAKKVLKKYFSFKNDLYYTKQWTKIECFAKFIGTGIKKELLSFNPKCLFSKQIKKQFYISYMSNNITSEIELFYK
ncbi:MAG: hypothetical protein LBM99_05790 [Bacillales bacterium]|nr:hypothetical protein [Bacillales bacterium]